VDDRSRRRRARALVDAVRAMTTMSSATTTSRTTTTTVASVAARGGRMRMTVTGARRGARRGRGGRDGDGTTVGGFSLFGGGNASSVSVDADEVRKNERECVLQTYGRGDTEVMVRGKGCALFDAEGREFLDFTAGIAVNCLGHADEGVSRVIAEQAKLLTHTSNLYHTEPGATLARKLVATSFADKVFYCNSGTEANEGALKFARKYAKTRAVAAGKTAEEAATETVSFQNGFHGRTFGALSLTWKEGYRAPFAPLIPGNTFTPYGDLEKAREVIVKGKTCAVFVEPVQGEGGIYPADAEFLRGLRKICDEADALLVYDEVQCGLGRTGKLWGHQLVKDAEPDLMTVAKPLANGLPIGAVLMKQKVADVMAPGDHGSTFAGGPLVCAVANEVFDRITAPGFLANVTARGEELKSALSAGLADHPRVREVRGAGLLVGVQFDVPVGALVKACREDGLLVITAGTGDILRLVPPLIVTSAEIQKAAAVVAKRARDVVV
jgi:acetylornithine aminotransferase